MFKLKRGQCGLYKCIKTFQGNKKLKAASAAFLKQPI